MSKYKIINNGMGEFLVKEKTRTYTGVRWLTIENTIDSFSTLEEARKKYSTAIVSNAGQEWFDNLAKKQNMPSNG